MKILCRLPPLRRHLELRKIKSRRDGASHQSPVAGAFGGLPGVRRYRRLRLFAGGQIAAEPDHAPAVAIGDLQTQRSARVIMPDLDRIDAVPVRAFATRQQEIDRRGERASVGITSQVAKRLAIMSAFRVRLEA